MASYWCEYAPESIFKKSAMMFIRTTEGRNTLAGDEFRIFTSAGVDIFVPKNAEEYQQALHIYFGIPVA